jgi:hypothetical protein
MAIVNRRNAFVGWVVLKAGKRVARRKARAAVPAVEGGRPNASAVAAGVAAAGGVVLFLRRLSRRDEDVLE